MDRTKADPKRGSGNKRDWEEMSIWNDNGLAVSDRQHKLSTTDILFTAKGNRLAVCDRESHQERGSIDLETLLRYLIATGFVEWRPEVIE